MLDKSLITRRFFSCQVGMSRSQVGKVYGVERVTVVTWSTRFTISWSKLKYLSDSQAINWDWILEGIGEKNSNVKNRR